MNDRLRTLAVTALLLFGSLGAADPTLYVPASKQTLHVAVPAPDGRAVEAGVNWQLVAAEPGGAAVPVDATPAIRPDGSRDEGGIRLVASIPPGAGQGSARPLRLETATADAPPAFRFGDMDDQGLGLWEGDRPILVYNHGVRSKPGVPSERNRSSYIHPLHGLDGEVLTDDFPEDHLHQRGLFWTWPHVVIDGQDYDLWLGGVGIEQRFERWLAREAGAVSAVLGVENGWYVGDRKVLDERIWLTVYRSSDELQAIDVDCYWTPTDRAVTLRGAEGKSYGGFSLRFAPRSETTITTPSGRTPDDLLVERLPWADLTDVFDGAAGPSGASIFVAREHPDYPPEWMLRHYGILCVGWPGVEPRTIAPGESIHAPYRVRLHRGPADATNLNAHYSSYEAGRAIRWPDEDAATNTPSAIKAAPGSD